MWASTRLESGLFAGQAGSECAAFRRMVGRLPAIQPMLHPLYVSDAFVREKLQISCIARRILTILMNAASLGGVGTCTAHSDSAWPAWGRYFDNRHVCPFCTSRDFYSFELNLCMHCFFTSGHPRVDFRNMPCRVKKVEGRKTII